MNDMTITPLPTIWNGWRFRSRLEARWAVYFDALCVPYEYELEGFEVAPGVCYLPDFYLPEHGCYAEVKPKRLDCEEAEKVLNFVASTGHAILLLVGSPEYSPYFKIWRKEPVVWKEGVRFGYTEEEFRVDSEYPCLSHCNAIYPFENKPVGFPELGMECVELWYGWCKRRGIWHQPCSNEASMLRGNDDIPDPVVAARQFKVNSRGSSRVIRC